MGGFHCCELSQFTVSYGVIVVGGLIRVRCKELVGMPPGRGRAMRAQHLLSRTRGRNTATGTTVAQLPEPVPEPEHTNRSQHVHYEPGQHRPTS